MGFTELQVIECSSYGISTGKPAGLSTAVTAWIVSVVMVTVILASVSFLLLNTRRYVILCYKLINCRELKCVTFLFVLSNKCCVVPALHILLQYNTQQN